MSKYPERRKQFYDSQRNRENYTFHPGRLFFLNFYPETGQCNILFLDDRELAILREMLAVFPKYHWVWQLPSPKKDWDAATIALWDDITAFVEALEAKLVAGCDGTAILNELKRLNAIVAGESVDLLDVNGNLIETVNYSAIGNPTLHRQNDNARLGEIRDKLNALQSLASDSTGQAANVQLGNIATELGNQVSELQAQASQLAAQAGHLSNIFSKLEELRTTIETRLTAETIAGNTRASELEAILDAIENVLGGTYAP